MTERSRDASTDPGHGVAPCYRHPDRPTGVRCVRCNRPICSECMRSASVGFQCPDDVLAGSRSVRPQRTTVGARLMQAPPYVTISLIVLNVAAYLATGLQKPGTLSDPRGAALFRDWNLYPRGVDQDGSYYQLITSAFLHLSPLHIAANMVSLALIGPPVERVLGWWRFGSAYLLAALGGSAAVYAFDNPNGYTAGASGAIFGLFGVGLVLVRKIGLDVQWLVATIVLNFAITYSVPNISKWGHFGGFVAGLLAGLAIGGLPRVRRRIPATVQGAGLVGLFVLIVIVVAVRTATFPSLVG